MTTEQTLVTELTAIRADLAELRRYVRTKPGHVERELPGVAGRLGACRPMITGDETGFLMWTPLRISDNLRVGLESILSCPDALNGYLTGADWELAAMIGRLEGGMSE